MCQRLWERALTAPTDAWKSATLDGQVARISTWQYPEVPASGVLELAYSVKLAIKPADRGVYFSTPMENAPFKLLADTLSSEALSDFDKVSPAMPRALCPRVAHASLHSHAPAPRLARARYTHVITAGAGQPGVRRLRR